MKQLLASPIQKIVSYVLTLAMLCSMLPTIAFAADVPETALHGSGTAEDPFQIYTANDIYAIQLLEEANVDETTYYFQQMADLDMDYMTANADSYYYVNTTFRGVYDGDGHTISHMTKPLFLELNGESLIGPDDNTKLDFYDPDSDNPLDIVTAGVFNLEIEDSDLATIPTDFNGGNIAVIALTGFDAAVCDVNFTNVNITSPQGALAAFFGWTSNHIIVDRCNLSNVDIVSKGGSSVCVVAGGSWGPTYIHELHIDEDCLLATNNGYNAYLGAIVTATNCTSVVDCTNSAEMRVQGYGGVFGMCYSYALIQNCVVDGSITLPNPTAPATIGGFIFKAHNINVRIVDSDSSQLQLPESHPDTLNQKIARLICLPHYVDMVDFDFSTEGHVGNYAMMPTYGTNPINGLVTDKLTLPYTADITLKEDCQVDCIEFPTGGTLHNYSEHPITVISGGNVTIAANEGTINLIDSEGNVTIYSNNGDISTIDAEGSLSICTSTSYEASTGTIGIGDDDTLTFGTELNIGNSKYPNTNIIGDITGAGESKYDTDIYNGATGVIGDLTIDATSDISVQKNEGVIGNLTNKSGSIYVKNTNQIGNLIAEGTSISVPENSGTIGDIQANTTSAIYYNTGEIGDVNAGSTVTVGSVNNKLETKGNVAPGIIGNITNTAGNIAIYRNTGTIGNVESKVGSITVGQYSSAYTAVQNNGGTIGNLTAATTVSVYSNEPGNIGNIDAGTTMAVGYDKTVANQNTIKSITANGTVTVGYVNSPNEGGVTDGVTSVGTVTGFSDVYFDVTATSNQMIFANTTTENSSYTHTTGGKLVLTKETDGSTTVKLDGEDTALYTYPADANIQLNLTTASVTGLTVNEGVVIDTISSRVSTTGIVNHGTINTIANSTSITIAQNDGTIGTMSTTVGNTSVTNNAEGTIDSIIYAGTSSQIVTVTNYGSITGVISNAAGTGGMTIKNLGTIPMTCDITQNKGRLTLTGHTANDVTDPLFVGDITTNGPLTLTGYLGANENNKSISATLLDNATITAAKAGFYLKVLGDAKTINLNMTGVDAGLNTVDVSTIADVTVGGSYGAGTALIGGTDGSIDSTNVIPTNTVPADTNLTGDVLLSYPNNNGTITVLEGAIVGSEGTVSMSAPDAIKLVNNGTMGDIQFLGSGSISITNYGTIGNVYAPNGSVSVVTNDGEDGSIGDITAKNGITITSSAKPIGNLNAGTTVYLVYNTSTIGTVKAGTTVIVGADKNAVAEKGNVGENAIIGNITAGTSATIYRNTGVIGTVTANTTSISIGQSGYEYQLNSGTIGDVTAHTAVVINHNTGTIGDIDAGDYVKVGVDKTTIAEKGNASEDAVIGNISAYNYVYIYRNAGKIGNISSKNDYITIGQNGYPYQMNGGTIGTLTTQNDYISIYVDDAATESAGTVGAINAGTTVTVGAATEYNQYDIPAIEAGSTITIYNGSGELSSLTSDGAITIPVNNGIIGTVNAGTSLSIGTVTSQPVSTGTIATDDGETITYGTELNIGNATNANGNTIGDITGRQSVTADNDIYNGADGEIGNITVNTTSDIYIYKNEGVIGSIENKTGEIIVNSNTNEIGDITSTDYTIISYNAGTIGNVDAGTYVKVGTDKNTLEEKGNSCPEATIGNINANSSVIIYRNAGTIGDVTADTSSISIGQNTYANQVNSGTIGALSPATTLTINDDAGTYTSGIPQVNGTLTLYLYDADFEGSFTANTSSISVTNCSDGQPKLIITSGGSVSNTANPDGVYAIINLTSTVPEGKRAYLAGNFENVIFTGDGTLLSSNSSKVIGSFITTGNGEYIVQSQVSSESELDTENAYTLTSIDQGDGTAKIYLISYPTAYAGAVSLNTTDGTLSANSVTLTGANYTQYLATVTFNTAGTHSFDITATCGEDTATVTGSVVIEALVSDVNTFWITDATAYETYSTSYGWTEAGVTTPEQFPVIAVVWDSEEIISVNGTEAAEVAFVAVDADTVEEGDIISIDITAGEGLMAYDEAHDYTVTVEDYASINTDEYSTVTLNYMDGITTNEVHTVLNENTITLPTPVRAGYVFFGWSDGESSYAADAVYTPESDVTLIAIWTASINTVTLNIDTITGGVIKNVINDTLFNISSGTIFAKDTEVTLTIDPHSNYRFNHWLVDGVEYSTEKTITITMDETKTIGADLTRYSSNIPTTSTSQLVTTNDDGSVTVTVATSATTSDSKITTTISDENMETAIQTLEKKQTGEGAYVKVPVTTKSNTDTVCVSISTEAADALAKSVVDSLIISSDLGGAEISSDALASVVEQAQGDTIVITITQVDTNNLTDKQVAVIGTASPVDVTITSGGVPVSYFDGHEIEISIPYTLKNGEAAENVVVWYVSDDGDISTMDTTYDEDTKLANFKTSHLSVYVVVCVEELAFSDVSASDYYYDAVQWAVDKNITTGTSATTFSPDATCTRAQAVTFLYRAAGEPEVYGDCVFTDVNEDTYYYDAVLWAVSEGITSGTSSTTFSPDDVCSRSQIVTFLYRAVGENEASGECAFTDVNADTYYYDAVLWAVSEGITSGTSATTFSPVANCTRGQIVTFLYRSMAE